MLEDEDFIYINDDDIDDTEEIKIFTEEDIMIPLWWNVLFPI